MTASFALILKAFKDDRRSTLAIRIQLQYDVRSMCYQTDLARIMDIKTARLTLLIDPNQKAAFEQLEGRAQSPATTHAAAAQSKAMAAVAATSAARPRAGRR